MLESTGRKQITGLARFMARFHKKKAAHRILSFMARFHVKKVGHRSFCAGQRPQECLLPM